MSSFIKSTHDEMWELQKASHKALFNSKFPFTLKTICPTTCKPFSKSFQHPIMQLIKYFKRYCAIIANHLMTLNGTLFSLINFTEQPANSMEIVCNKLPFLLKASSFVRLFLQIIDHRIQNKKFSFGYFDKTKLINLSQHLIV